MSLLAKPHVRAVLSSGFMFSFLGVGFEVVFVLYSYTRIDLGGMGRSVRLRTFECRGYHLIVLPDIPESLVL